MAVNQVPTALDTSPEPLSNALGNAPEPLPTALDNAPTNQVFTARNTSPDQGSNALDSSPNQVFTAMNTSPEPLPNALDNAPMSDAARFLAPTRRWPERKPKPPRPEPTETGRTIWIGG